MALDETIGTSPNILHRDKEIKQLVEEIFFAESSITTLNREAVLAGLGTISTLGDLVVAESSFKTNAVIENTAKQARILRFVLRANDQGIIQPPLEEPLTAQQLLSIQLEAASRVGEILNNSFNNPLSPIDYRKPLEQRL